MEFADYHAIHNLINRYAQYADKGDFKSIAEHYARCRLVFPDGEVLDVLERGPEAYLEWYANIIRLYDDGTPKTCRLMGTIIIDDDGPLRAKAESSVVCFQGTDKLPLQPVATAILYDRFEKIDGTWWIVERREEQQLAGDLSHHVYLDRL